MHQLSHSYMGIHFLCVKNVFLYPLCVEQGQAPAELCHAPVVATQTIGAAEHTTRAAGGLQNADGLQTVDFLPYKVRIACWAAARCSRSGPNSSLSTVTHWRLTGILLFATGYFLDSSVRWQLLDSGNLEQLVLGVASTGQVRQRKSWHPQVQGVAGLH